MKKGKRLFSYLGSGFAFSMLFGLAAFLPEAKAEAKLSLNAIDYEKSTITIETDSSDTTLYFSDKNKKKWETSMDSFVGNKCTMDISWVSVTKDYVMTFKGDKSGEDILTVTIPKQVSNFKAKYDKKGSKVVFTNKPSDRKVQYRKNNTSQWTTIVDENSFGTNLQRLYENGAKVYFRLEAENGSGGSEGKRYSKEVVCSITKKSEAPKVTINDDATITVQSGWQVRRVTMNEEDEYVTGYEKIDSIEESDPNYDASSKWYTYRSEKNIKVTDIVTALKASNVKETDKKTSAYLQFRKEASSSAQVSHITTIKIPQQEAAPVEGDMSIEYTSFTTFNIKVEKATTKNPYEYCIVSKSDVKDGKIVDPEDAKWKTINSSSAVEVKKADAPENGSIFLRKKAVGTLGEDDFRLATEYICAKSIKYPTAEAETLAVQNPTPNPEDGSIDIIDGVCTKDNPISFTITTQWNYRISKIWLTKNDNLENAPSATENVADDVTIGTNSVSKSGNQNIITATITGIKLRDKTLEEWEESNSDTLRLYAYIQYEKLGVEDGLRSGMVNNKAKGLVINLKKKSSIEFNDNDITQTKNIERIIGAETGNETVSYTVNFNNAIGSIELGNYSLGEKDYKLDGNKFTIYVSELEKEEKLKSYYNKSQKLIIKLKNGEKLDDITINFMEPVSLKQFYSWAYRSSSLPICQTTTTTSTNGDKVVETKQINNYSVEYKEQTKSVNEIKVDEVAVVEATLDCATNSAIKISILDTFDNNTKKIQFSNELLKSPGLVGLTSKPVNITFDITLSNKEKYKYTMKQGCIFTVLP